MSEIPEIGVDEVRDDVVLLDVREADEWAAGRAPGAIHVALSELADATIDVEPGATLQVICPARACSPGRSPAGCSTTSAPRSSRSNRPKEI